MNIEPMDRAAFFAAMRQWIRANGDLMPSGYIYRHIGDYSAACAPVATHTGLRIWHKDTVIATVAVSELYSEAECLRLRDLIITEQVMPADERGRLKLAESAQLGRGK